MSKISLDFGGNSIFRLPEIACFLSLQHNFAFVFALVFKADTDKLFSQLKQLRFYFGLFQSITLAISILFGKFKIWIEWKIKIAQVDFS